MYERSDFGRRLQIQCLIVLLRGLRCLFARDAVGDSCEVPSPLVQAVLLGSGLKIHAAHHHAKDCKIRRDEGNETGTVRSL